MNLSFYLLLHHLYIFRRFIINNYNPSFLFTPNTYFYLLFFIIYDYFRGSKFSHQDNIVLIEQ